MYIYIMKNRFHYEIVRLEQKYYYFAEQCEFLDFQKIIVVRFLRFFEVDKSLVKINTSIDI